MSLERAQKHSKRIARRLRGRKGSSNKCGWRCRCIRCEDGKKHKYEKAKPAPDKSSNGTESK